MRKLYVPISFFLISAFFARPAAAFSFVQRCDHEWEVIGEVSPRHMEGRHAWAAKCGVLKQTKLDFILHELGHMASFTKEGHGNNDVAPFHRDAPCDPPGTWEFLTSCPLGCFAETQEVMFGGGSMTIPEGVARGQEMVTTLRPDSSPFNLATKHDTVISSVTYGEERHDLIAIALFEGPEVVVTSDHPMVLGDGRFAPASELRVGDHLLTLDGPSPVKSLTSRPPQGKVWNIRPESKDVMENVIIASGVLTGSLRFQNEWAEKRRHLWMMDDLAEDDVHLIHDVYGAGK